MKHLEFTTTVVALAFAIGEHLSRAKAICDSGGRVDQAEEFVAEARRAADVLGGMVRSAQMLLSPEEFEQFCEATTIPMDVLNESLVNTNDFIARLPKLP